MDTTEVKQAYPLYRTSSIEEVRSALKTLHDFFVRNIPPDPSPLKDIAEYVVTMEEVANVHDIADMYDDVDRQLILFVDTTLVRAFVENPDDEGLQTQLQDELTLIAAAVNGVPGLDTYPPEDVASILTGRGEGGQYNALKYIHSLRQFVEGDKRLVVAQSALDLLDYLQQGVGLDQKMYFEDVVVSSLLLDIAWLSFGSLSDEERHLLCEQYFYVSIVLGVPIRKALESYVYSTTDIVDFFIAYSSIFLGLSKNSEEAYVNATSGERIPLLELISRLEVQYKESSESGFSHSEFIAALYSGQPHADIFSLWLREALYIFYKVKNADLIDHNWTKDEFRQYEDYRNQLKQLIGWSFRESDFPNFVAYYQSGHPQVPLSAFIESVRPFESLKEEGTVTRFLSLSGKLREGGVLSESEDLVSFNESTGSMEWSSLSKGR